MIKITVHLHTILQRQTPEGMVSRIEVSLQPGSTLEDLIEKLEISLAPDGLLLALNGRLTEPAQVLHEGDQVNLMPAISGG